MHRIGRTGRIGREGVAITLVDPREHRFLRSIEALTKQRIEILKLPSVDDLRARRLEATREAVRAQLEAGGFEPLRGVVESLVQEFDALDVAAAAIHLVHEASEKGLPQEVIPAAGGSGRRHRGTGGGFRARALGPPPRAVRPAPPALLTPRRVMMPAALSWALSHGRLPAG